MRPQQAALLLVRFREGAREAGKDRPPCRWLHRNLSWAPTDEEAERHVVER